MALLMYALTALWCWLTPSRIAGDGEMFDFVINPYPIGALALASGALALLHAGLWLHGRLVVVVAACWAVATVTMVTSFALLPRVAPSMFLTLQVAEAVVVAAAACALLLLAWQLARHRCAPRAHVVTRALTTLGVVLLALCYGGLALQGLGVITQPAGLDQLADAMAGLTVNLSVGSAVLGLATISHGVFSLGRPQPRAT
jgi:hypothetical protein